MRKYFSDGLKAAILILMLAPAQAAPRVATSDWTTAETLAAMGHPPVSLGDKRAYRDWVNHPPMPQTVLDSGLRFQPNLEQLYRVKPDFFIQSPWFGHLKTQFEQIAPVHEVRFSTDNGIRYAQTLAATRRLGRIIGDSAAAERLIGAAESQFARQRKTLAPHAERPLAVIQFVDARHARIYGHTSMYHVVLQKLGLKNAWQGDSNEWGFANIALTDLAKLPPDTLLIIVQPHPRNTRSALGKSALWQRLPFAKPQNRRILPPSWSYGALPSMQHFADGLAQQLPSEKESAW
ncbi:ABC transporter substrate-binding protein [Uruburuella testudinis]|uniref:ABC transporter substrate-binding protein n=1 Tax=Uruburuella testudinis TaxID=1282863 RepID=A0ABY4DP05_9NEIS|nr:ABC transporter substrate-binding protein [Uruburuella testudinis]UOO80793.1 ABC transporter substrate-binding protein [Uruburuella testudinis]